MTGGFTPFQIALLVAAVAAATGGLASMFLARSRRDSSLRNVIGMRPLSEPTFAVLGAACLIGAHQLAAPVFHWPGVRGPMGALMALAVVAAVGSIVLDRTHHKRNRDDEPQQDDEP